MRVASVFAVLAVALAAPAAAAAGTASVAERQFSFVAAPGEANRVVIVRTPDFIRVTDAGAPVVAGPGCTSVTPNEVECVARVHTVNARLGDGDDRVSIGTATLASISGGEGEDVLESGEGDDVLDGGPGADILKGGVGADRLIGGPGPDILSGGTLAVEELNGAIVTRRLTIGICKVREVRDVAHDIALYYDRRVPLRISLDGVANDGAAGEGDNVLDDVEVVDGGTRGDTLIGDARRNFLQGGPGSDTLVGRGGPDVLEGEEEIHGARSGTRRNRLLGGAGGDCLLGGGGGDSLRGSYGADTLSGEGGRDSLRAGAGRDYVLAHDLARDLVDGGADADRAAIDRRDRVARVERLVAPPPPPPGPILRAL